MSSPTKARRLPAWTGCSIPPHAQPIGIKGSKEISQHEQSASCQQHFEDITESSNSPNTADVGTNFGESGANPPIQDISKLMVSELS